VYLNGYVNKEAAREREREEEQAIHEVYKNQISCRKVGRLSEEEIRHLAFDD
jgi:hypothetical protein